MATNPDIRFKMNKVSKENHSHSHHPNTHPAPQPPPAAFFQLKILTSSRASESPQLKPVVGPPAVCSCTKDPSSVWVLRKAQ